MKKSLKYIIVISAITVAMSTSLIGWLAFKKEAGLLIHNQTDQEVANVSIQYSSSGKKIDIGIMKPDGYYMHDIEDENEDSIKLIYTEPSGTEHQEVVIGYVTKGMKNGYAAIKKGSDGKWQIESRY